MENKYYWDCRTKMHKRSKIYQFCCFFIIINLMDKICEYNIRNPIPKQNIGEQQVVEGEKYHFFPSTDIFCPNKPYKKAINNDEIKVKHQLENFFSGI